MQITTKLCSWIKAFVFVWFFFIIPKHIQCAEKQYTEWVSRDPKMSVPLALHSPSHLTTKLPIQKVYTIKILIGFLLVILLKKKNPNQTEKTKNQANKKQKAARIWNAFTEQPLQNKCCSPG